MSEYILAKESELIVVRSQTSSNLSISFAFAPPHQQRLLNSLGISGNIVLDDKSGFNGIAGNGYSLKTTATGTIILDDTTKTVKLSTIAFIGSAQILNVTANQISFLNGTISNLKFKDTLGNDYFFPCCESYSNTIHNLQTTCNAKMSGFVWYANDEYFPLTVYNFEVLNNITNTKKLFIVKKINGNSNYETSNYINTLTFTYNASNKVDALIDTGLGMLNFTQTAEILKPTKTTLGAANAIQFV